jgi:hypothetical protein
VPTSEGRVLGMDVNDTLQWPQSSVSVMKRDDEQLPPLGYRAVKFGPESGNGGKRVSPSCWRKT